MIRLRSILIGLAAVACASCALPPGEYPEQSFVPDKDLDIVSLVRQGLADYQKSRYVDAEFQFRRALYLRPAASNVKANLAAALRASGQFDEAEDILLSLNAAAPDSLEYLSGLARLYVDKGDFARSRRYYSLSFDRALKKGDFASASRFARNLSAIAFRVGDESAALCHSQVSLALKPDSDSTMRHARLLLGLNRPQQAKSLISAYSSQSGATASGPLVVESAVAELALGNTQRALELARSVEGNADLNREISDQLAKVVAIAKVRLGKASGEEDETSDGESSGTERGSSGERELESPRQSLYWPGALLPELSPY